MLQNTKIESLSQKQDPVSNKDLEKSLEQVKDNTEALKADRKTNFHIILFYDKSATTPDKAYPLEKIIEKEEWDCLGDLLNFPPGAKLTPDAYPIFVCNRVQKLEHIKVCTLSRYFRYNKQYLRKLSLSIVSFIFLLFPSSLNMGYTSVGYGTNVDVRKESDLHEFKPEFTICCQLIC